MAEFRGTSSTVVLGRESLIQSFLSHEIVLEVKGNMQKLRGNKTYKPLIFVELSNKMFMRIPCKDIYFTWWNFSVHYASHQPRPTTEHRKYDSALSEIPKTVRRKVNYHITFYYMLIICWNYTILDLLS